MAKKLLVILLSLHSLSHALSLKPVVTLNPGRVQMSDLLTGAEKEKNSQRMPLDFIFPGERKIFSYSEISQIIRDDSIKIPPRVLIVGQNKKLDEAALTEMMESYLSYRYQGQVRVTYEVTHLESVKSNRWSLRILNDDTFPYINLELITPNHKSAKLQFKVKVDLTRQALVTRSAVKSEDLVLANVYIENKAVTNIKAAFVTPADVEGKVFAYTLSPGTLVTTAHLKFPQLVKYGDVVRLQMHGSGFQVGMDGVAQGSASQGQKVRLKIPATGKIILAQMTGSGLAEIEGVKSE